jgi:4-amino-4-deoxychorismate lyase
MSRLIESIKLLDGTFYNLFYHEQRMSQSLQTLYQCNVSINLEKLLGEKNYPSKGLYKCRVVYDDLSSEITCTPYTPKKIDRIKIVENDEIAYEFKFSDREKINQLFELRGDCDDILIVRHGRVTDCSFSNIVFRHGRKWFTPSTPLLRGTMRQNLIDRNKILVKEIYKSDIRSFDTFRIINALLEFDSPEIEVSNIVF